jgi:ATP-binding cassette subfamily F protein 3
MIFGLEHQDSGLITIPRDYKVGYLEQKISFTKPTVIEEVMLALKEDHEVDNTWQAEKILFGLGLNKDQMSMDPHKLSGGYQIRLNLAKLLLSAPNLLLLDEPNNYLDVVSIRWLAGFLNSWNGEIILVTHDRSFMDNVVTHIAGINRRKMRKIEGNTKKYYDHIEELDELHEKNRIKEEKKIKHMEEFIDKFRAKARQANMVQSRLKTLEKQKPLEKLEQTKVLDFFFNEAPFTGKYVIDIKDLAFGYDDKALIDKLSLCIGHGDKICVIGKNGKGKTTLLKLIDKVLKPKFGELNVHQNAKIGFFEQTNVNTLSEGLTVLEEVYGANPQNSQQKARDICGSLMFEGDDALKRISVLSGGEKCRVLLAKIIASSCNTLLLDEPSNHLDMDSSNSLLKALQSFNGTVLMVTHNELFLSELAQKLVVFINDKVMVFDGAYDDFLKKIGWGDDSSLVRKDNKQGSNSRKEQKRKRSELIQEKSRTLKPLETKLKKIEHDIKLKEKEFEELNKLVVEASHSQDASKIKDYSQQLSTLKAEIDTLYVELEPIHDEYQTKSDYFEQMLNSQDPG